MIDPSDQRPGGQLSPQLAMRVAILGGMALAIFAIIFFRLWFLQVLSGDQYLAQASSNRVRDVTVQAPRGELLDRNGAVLVENRNAVAVTVAPQALPEDEGPRQALLRRLSRVLGDSTRPESCRLGRRRFRRMPLECTIDQQAAVTPYADVVVEPDASRAVYSYLAERAGQFPGVDIQNAWLREYPFKTVGAHLFGTVGQIDENGLRDDNFRGVRGGSIVGKTGLEYTYDKYLRGANGAQRIEVDAQGRPKRKLREVAPVKGSDVQLSIDARLQRVGQQALVNGIGLAQANGNPADGGAFVALDPRNGEVLAMGSNPTFDPNDFTRPIPTRVYRSAVPAGVGQQTRSSTARSAAASRSARPSRSSPPRPRSRAASSRPGRTTTTPARGEAARRYAETPAARYSARSTWRRRSRSRSTPSSTTSARDSTRIRRPIRAAASCRDGRASSASASGLASTSAAR